MLVAVLGVAALLVSYAATDVPTKSTSGSLCSNVLAPAVCANGEVAFKAGAVTPPAATFNASDWMTSSTIPGLNPAEGSWPVGSLGNFRFLCWASHLNYDDPIVYPGEKAKAHLHMFFGNRNLSYQTTAENITKSGSGSCYGGPLNRTGYWIPALLDSNNKARIPNWVVFYYKSQGLAVNSIQPYPTGLRMIQGNMNATSSQNDWRIQWQCLNSAESNIYPGQEFSVIPNCPAGNKLKLQFLFPQCGARNADGTPKLDSPDHKSHMIVQTDSHVCPSSHPIPYPEVSLNMIWNVTGSNANTWYLSSDRMGGVNKPGGTTTHADWFMGWDENTMNTFVNRCIREGRNSNNGNLCNGTSLKAVAGPEGGRFTGAEVVDPPAVGSQYNVESAFPGTAFP